MRSTNWPDETVRLLENWSMWVCGIRSFGNASQFPAYNLAVPGKRAGNIVPILCAEAEKADRIITAMTSRHQQPIRLHYLWQTRNIENKARSCNCAIGTYYTRLDEAHALFSREWYQAAGLRVVEM